MATNELRPYVKARTLELFIAVGNGAVERTRTSTVLLPPAPQAGASASSATTAFHSFPIIVDTPPNCEVPHFEVMGQFPITTNQKWRPVRGTRHLIFESGR